MADNNVLSPPLAVITEDDQRGVLWIVGLLCLAFIYMTIGLRTFVRWRRWQSDDFALFAACILALVQCTVAFVAARIGLGATFILSNESRMIDVWRMFLASEAFAVAALFMAKAAVILTIDKLLARDMRAATLYRWGLYIVGVLGLAAVIGVTVSCGNPKLDYFRTDACHQTPRWIAVAAVDVVSDVVIFLGFVMVVWSLQIKTSFKLTSIALLGGRLGCIPFTVVHAYYMSDFETDLKPSVSIIQPLVWQQLLLLYSLLSAMIVALKPFLKDFHTGMGMGLGHAIDGSGYGRAYAKGTVNSDRAFKLDVLKSDGGNTNSNNGNGNGNIGTVSTKEVRADAQRMGTDHSARYRPEEVQYSANIFHPQRRQSFTSTESEQPIIRRDVEYTISYEQST